MGFFMKGNAENNIISQPDFASLLHKDVKMINAIVNKLQIVCLGIKHKVWVKIAFLISFTSTQCVI